MVALKNGGINESCKQSWSGGIELWGDLVCLIIM